MRRSVIIPVVLHSLVAVATLMWLLWYFIPTGNVFNGLTTLLILILAGWYVYKNSRSEEPASDGTLPAAELPLLDTQGPVVLVCGDGLEALFQGGPLRKTAQGWWLRAGDVSRLTDVVRSIQTQFPRQVGQLSVMYLCLADHHQDEAVLRSALKTLRQQCKQIKSLTGFTLPVVLSAEFSGPETPWIIVRGDKPIVCPVIAPAGRSNTDSCHYVHIEVISNDTRMPEFLNNPAGITSGQKYIRLHPGADLYTKSGEGEQSVFTKTTSQTEKDSGKILCVADCYPFEDSQHRTWYKVSDNSWMSRDGVDLLNQYDLKELGFNTLEEAPSPDVSKSLREDWVKGAYNWLSERVGKERGIQQKQVSAFYKNLVKKIDSDGDGELSGKELYNALHHPELGLRDIVARLIVKHDSEWFGGSSHHRWNVFFQNYDRLRVAYAKQWLDDSEWMSQVDAFKEGKPVWHFHPVMFLSNLADINVHKRRDNNLGTLSSHYETGGRGSRTVSGGVGDAGGVSYGSYQMTSQTTKKIHGELRVIIGGTVKIFVTSGDFRWRSEFANLTPGTTAFTSKWKELVDAHPDDFKDAEHQFIKETHFDKLVQHTINETNVDVRYHSHTLNDVVWSTAVHHGPENNVIINAINATGFTPAENKIYDEALIKAIYQERGRKKTDGKLAYFSKNSLEVQAGVSSRFIREGKEALERLKNESDY